MHDGYPRRYPEVVHKYKQCSNIHVNAQTCLTFSDIYTGMREGFCTRGKIRPLLSAHRLSLAGSATWPLARTTSR